VNGSDYQGMSETVVAKLLAFIQGYDNRFTWDRDVLLLWQDAAREGRWTEFEAAQAIRAFYLDNEADEFISIGKVNRRIRRARQDRMSREAAPRGGDAAIDGTGYAVGDDPAWGANNSAELEQVHREALVVACPSCHQGVEERCKNTITGNATKVPHLKRMKAAGFGSPSRKVNRAMVLKHPDLIAELRKPPCSFKSPENWGGYLPPDRDSNGVRNGSIYRQQLVAVVEEARRREAQETT
jgi:hypothetical protein